ncbi:hypothetical protein L208DRAFT_1072530, partial [Tricholoma matsutake]
ISPGVTASLDDNSASIQGTQMKVCELLNSISNSVGIITNIIKHILESHLLLMFRLVACLGLQQWAPDVLGNNPESMYNLLHEHIALKTFEQVLGTFGYSHLGTNVSCVNNFALMHELDQSFIFSYMHGIAKSEAKNPGSVAKAKQMTRLAEGNAESVDVVYHIKEKEGHLTKVTASFRIVDQERKQMNRSKRRHLKLANLLTALPKRVQIDWFDPIYWNNL